MFVDLGFAHRYFKNHGANVSDLSFYDGPSGNSRQKLQEQGWNSRLFYFSGHGSGGEIIKDARPTGTLTIVLDCCYAGSLALGSLLLPSFQQTRHTGYTNKEMSSRVWWSICAFLPFPMPPPWTSLGMVLPGRALACAMDFSVACALDLLWAKTRSKTDQYCVAGALLCMWGKSGSEGRGLSLTCVAPFAETGTPCIVYLLPCLYVAGVTLSSSYITLVWQCGCKSLWLNVIILCTCQWTSPFWCACERTLNISPHPSPHHPTPDAHVDGYEYNFPGNWLIASRVSAQVSEISSAQLCACPCSPMELKKDMDELMPAEKVKCREWRWFSLRLAAIAGFSCCRIVVQIQAAQRQVGLSSQSLGPKKGPYPVASARKTRAQRKRSLKKNTCNHGTNVV